MAFQARFTSEPARESSALPGAAIAPDPALEFSEVYEQEATSAAAPSSDRLPAGLERLIEIVCEHHGFSPPEILEAKAFAKRDPSSASDFFGSLYREEVLPSRELRENPLPKALAAHPGQSCFLYSNGVSQAIIAIPAEFPALRIYHGKTLELVSREDSPFP